MKYVNSFYNGDRNYKNYRMKVIKLLKTRKYSRYKKENKKIIKIYIDKEEDYKNFMKDATLFNEPDGIKILCIPSYLEHLYNRIE